MKNFREFYTEVMSVSTRKKMAKRMAKLARSPAVKMKKARTKLKVRNTAKLTIVARKEALKTIKLKKQLRFHIQTLYPSRQHKPQCPDHHQSAKKYAEGNERGNRHLPVQ